jgi:hypothetical protein
MAAPSTPAPPAPATPPAAKPDAKMSEPKTLADARKKLQENGYARVKTGTLTVPNFSRIETWMGGPGGVVYLAYNEFGWALLTNALGRQPSTVENLSAALERVAGQ